MIIKPTNYYDLTKNLRNVVIDASGVDKNRVFNAISVRGPDLSKIISSSETSSFQSKGSSDAFIVFELIENSDEDFYSTRQDEGTMITTVPYVLNLKIYGSECHQISQMIFARFKRDDVLRDLRDFKGAYIEGVSNVTSINEFINETLWQRCDMSVYLTSASEEKIPSEEGKEIIEFKDLVLKSY